MLLCTLVTSSAQIVWKLGANVNQSINLGPLSIPASPYIIGGYFLYGIAALLLIIALRGGELSVLYPIIATSYVWVSIASSYFFPLDSMNLLKWSGVLLIVCGVGMIGYGSERDAA